MMGFLTSLKTSMVLHMLLGFVWLISGLILSLMMFITYLTIWPFNRDLYRKICSHLAYLNWSQFVFLAQFWSGCKCRLFCDDPALVNNFGKEHSLVVMNHNKDIDWVMTWILSDSFSLLGCCKVFAKDTVKYLPIFGWMWTFTETIFLRRDWNKDKEHISKSLQNIVAYPDDYWVTLLIFAEGTRFTKEKHQVSVEFAKSKGIQPFKHHLIPRAKGFIACVREFKGKGLALYDATICFPENQENKPTFKSLLNGKPCYASIYLRRFLIDDIPCDTDEECSAWLMNLYREKDEVYENFVQNDDFTIGTEVPLIPRINSFVIWWTWTILITVTSCYYFCNILISGSIYTILAIIFFFVLFFFFGKKMMSVTETGKGSSYGSSPKHKPNVQSNESSQLKEAEAESKSDCLDKKDS